jgi:hypothetical protein
MFTRKLPSSCKQYVPLSKRTGIQKAQVKGTANTGKNVSNVFYVWLSFLWRFLRSKAMATTITAVATNATM